MDNLILEMQTLIDELNRASDAYYNGHQEILTDYEWDSKFDRLKQLEEQTGEILPDSPTAKVSEDNIQGQKEEHEFAALSLAKTKKVSDLAKWAEMREIWISWKLDGLTLVVTYDGGKLQKVVTRGNGHTGTNITHLASAVSGILPSVPDKGHVVIRGEAVISYADFEQFLIESDEDYANPRNLASGSLSLKDVEEVKKRHIRWIPSTLVHCDREIVSWGERMDYLESMGFTPVERVRISSPSEEAISEVIDRWTVKVTSGENPYPVDGLVINYDDTVYASTGSVTGHHATRAGLAFKWQDESVDSVLDHIEWSCAASVISPVAVFAPVEIEGSTVKRASLCNISECERLGIGGPGTGISVIKANKIIPKVIKVTERSGELEIPDRCPVCGHRTEIRTSAVSGTKTLFCTNPDCTAKQLKKFTRFVSKEAMNMEGLSEQTLYKFINLGWIKDFQDLYSLKDHADELKTMDGFGEKSVQNLLDAIERSRSVSAQSFIYALCIPLCGIDVARRMLSKYDVATLGQTAKTAMASDTFAVIDGIGPEKSASFIKWFKDEHNYSVFEALLKEVTVKESAPVSAGGKCDGLVFVVTGDVYKYKNRSELKAYIESQGGKVTGSVSGSTSFLINNDINSSSSKNRKAKELGIEIISEDMFIERFNPELM